MREAAEPRTKKEVQSFLGLTGYYRNYIPNYSAIASPLTDHTRKGLPNKIEWSEPQKKAYCKLKSSRTKCPILHLPDFSKVFYLRTDAFNHGIGAILMQETNNELFPVSFASKKLSIREQKYSTTEKECLAIIWAVKKFRNYLHGIE